MSYQKSKTVLLRCLVALWAIGLTPPVTVHAAQSRGYDFVVIVDQSGSMSGTRGSASDEHGVRNDMVKRAFQLLAKDGVLNQVTHRFGVISFGDDASIVLPLSPISPAAVDRLQNKLVANLDNDNMGFTHFLAAFKAARRMFGAPPLAEPGKRVVLLITDGAPYVKGIRIAEYKKELKQLLETGFPHPDFQVHVVALNDPSSNYWNQYEAFWKELSHNNALKLGKDREIIFRTLSKVVGDIIGTSSRHVPRDMYDNVVIPPYLESVVFDIFRVDPGVKVDIFSQERPGTPLSAKDKHVTVTRIGRTIQSVAVKNPQPGSWRIRKSRPNARVDVYTQRFFPRGKLVYPTKDQSLRQFQKIPVKYRVEDGDGKPIRELPGYPLTLELSLVKPDKSRIQMKMRKSLKTAEKPGNGIYETEGEILCNQAGAYKAEIVIATKDLKNRGVTLFRDQWSGFTVQGARQITGRLISPQPLEHIPLYRELVFFPRPMEFIFKFTDAQGNALNLPALLGGPPRELIRAVSLDGGAETPVPMEFQYRGEGVLAGIPGAFTRPGTYRLRFFPDNSVVPSRYTVTVNPGRFSFKRGLTLLHWAQLIGLASVLLFSFFYFGYKLYLGLRFPLAGKLYLDRLGDKPIVEYPLSGRRHRLKLKGLPIETGISTITLRAARDSRGGITVLKVFDNKNELLLEDRTIRDRGSASLRRIPYVLRYRLK